MSVSTNDRLERLLADRARLATRLDDRCAALLAALRERCPDAVPPPAPPPGGIAAPVVLQAVEVEPLLRAALGGDTDDGLVLLVDGDSELLVQPDACRLDTDDGLVLVVLAVECDQTGPVNVVVPFAVGDGLVNTGMVAATEHAPRGPTAIVARWGEALTALAWESLLSVAGGLTRHAGADGDAMPLLPGALVAGRGALTVVPQARHERDRPGRP